jgi:hypothetical protein
VNTFEQVQIAGQNAGGRFRNGIVIGSEFDVAKFDQIDSAAPVGGAVAMVVGCQFPNAAPFRRLINWLHLVALGNRGVYFEPSKLSAEEIAARGLDMRALAWGVEYTEYFPFSVFFDDELTNIHRYNRARLALEGVRGISGGTILSVTQNLIPCGGCGSQNNHPTGVGV